ncbi:4-alpha-glucanotransferase [Actinokineospora fastidiosa]|uniref:4-alpha-glucanotransferase n=1 Tax=Actinokineospora fastidiosa TaxID=1816 RepID=A0A918GR61_9PSEU|nr:4-alpha-glucanotransferase [Actinokineospora fastidiosa]
MITEDLATLASAYGVSTGYEDGAGDWHDVDAEVVVAVLAQLGVPAGSPDEISASIAAAPADPTPTVVTQGDAVHLGQGELLLEDGGTLPVDGVLPADAPLGWHRLRRGDTVTPLAVTPARLTPVPRAWGWMVQLYALHSERSWGIGDYADLRTFAAGTAAQGAGALLVSPVGAITPTEPVERSPYSPSSRRFHNPLLLSVTETEAFRAADPDTRAAVLALRPDEPDDLIDYQAVWRAKSAALALLAPREVPEPDAALGEFATFCALAERHGGDWRTWPHGLRRPDSPEVAAARRELAERVAFHVWVQRECAAQLASAHAAAHRMAVGILHDLPVGVDPGGADAWALQDVLAADVTVGAPPDAFSPKGQDWALPPLRPDRLAAEGYLPFRDMIRAVLAHGDGIRVDHVAGLWRLWWIPPGQSPDRGTYVRYDGRAMLGVLALEAHRAGAVVVGEDLGTVPDEVSAELRERGALGCAVAWFERDDDGKPLPPERWPARAVATLSTHDLPTAAGFLSGEHVRVRADLGLLDDPDAEARRARQERDDLLDLLAAEGLTDDDRVLALHELLARTPCDLVLAAPTDVIGDTRQPNLPGTVDEYPNWRIRLRPDVHELLADARMQRIAALLGDAAR